MTSTAATPTLAGLVAEHLLDAELAALTWLLMERGVPVLVAGREARDSAGLLDALVRALPPERRPPAAEPGVVAESGVVAEPGAAAAPGTTASRLVRVAAVLARDTVPGVLRAALGATTGRSGLAGQVAAEDLAGVLTLLGRQGLSDDEASFLGVVLVVARPAESGGEPRVTAVHYLRPVVRDAGGHLRRRAPAVLATWEPQEDRWEHFAWGIVPDLAERCGMRAGDLEAERLRRAEMLAGGTSRGPVR